MLKIRFCFLAALFALPTVPASAAGSTSDRGDLKDAADATPEGTAEDAARADPNEEAYPISGSFGVLYRFNHANFVPTESNEANFGYQFMRVSGSVSYEIIENLSVAVGLGADKETAKSYNRPAVGGGAFAGGPSNRKLYGTELRDATVGVSWAAIYTIPVVDIAFNAALTGYVPLSRTSRSYGMITMLSPDLSASWSLDDFSAELGVAELYYVNKSPTVQVDCAVAPEFCDQSGKDATLVNPLHDLSTYLTLSYSILEPLSIKGTYSIGNSWSAATFPHDDFSSEFAQDGAQDGTGYHLTQFAVRYKILDRTSITADMLTIRLLHTNDGKSTTVPLFDFDSNLSHRTRYTVSLAQGF